MSTLESASLVPVLEISNDAHNTKSKSNWLSKTLSRVGLLQVQAESETLDINENWESNFDLPYWSTKFLPL